MNRSVVIAGIGGLLLGGTGGILLGGKPDSVVTESEGHQQPSKTNSSKVTGKTRQSEIVRNLTQFREDPSKPAHVHNLLDYYANLGPEMFKAEAARIKGLPISESALATHLLFAQWSKVDPRAAFMNSLELDHLTHVVRPVILRNWTSSDPEGAAQFLKDTPRKHTRFDATLEFHTGEGPIGTVASEWARHDPDAALAWAQGLKGPDAAKALERVIMQSYSDDPAAALQMANSLNDEAQQTAYASIVQKWGEEDWSAMEGWARGLPADQGHTVLAEGLKKWAQRDHLAAASKLLTMTEGDARDGAYSGVITSYSKKDPQGAMEFLLANGNEAAQKDAIQAPIALLARADPTVALKFIDSLDDNAVRDAAVLSFSANAALAYESKPQEIVYLAATIGEDWIRTKAVSNAAADWFGKDAAAADAYFSNNDIIDPTTLQNIKNRAEAESKATAIQLHELRANWSQNERDALAEQSLKGVQEREKRNPLP